MISSSPLNKKQVLHIRVMLIVFMLTGMCLSTLRTNAQQTTGSSGLLNIPVGDIYPDKTMSIGTNYLPEGQAGERFDYNTANYFFNLSFLPFIEATYRLTLLKVVRNNKRVTNQDRAFGVKWRLWKEKRILPSIVAGMDDIYTSSGSGNQYFASSYVVSGKTINLHEHLIRFTAGYGFNPRDRNRLKGWFGGIDYSPRNLRSVSLMAEYDSWRINMATSVLLWKHLSVYAGCYGFDQPAAGISYRFVL